ncbi:cupin domain-containing protein [Microbacterium pseudoresistens]|uniref:Transcriptional regulator with XRE-family HTH domain n=1 Tax=Microbacterium pseudoresistens TaxID=640634 RepID=A0A7Y9ETX6_9MICO|nr:cupin domain-containing protein [Microbacterium pseudoresistens]NYD53716.1 transcriptional regulator with XRE-family HTH domain [Microbacterium pseudoresistens]
MTDNRDDQTKAIGAAVRSYRKARGLTLRQLAEKTGLSAAFLSLAERGLSAFALTSLRAIATALEVETNDLLTFESEETAAGEAGAVVADPEVHVHHRDEPAAMEIVASGYRYRLLSSPWPGKQLETLLVTVPPAVRGEVSSGHEGEEFCYVLKGELIFIVGDEEYLLREGESIHIDSSHPHTLHNATESNVETLWSITPPIFAQSSSAHIPSMKRRRL